MLITKSFVCINFPKTGSTFMRSMIKKAYARKNRFGKLFDAVRKFLGIDPPVRELILPNFQSPNKNTRDRMGQHGAVCQIPEEDRHKTIVTIARNPFDKFVSTYVSKWWTVFFPLPQQTLQEMFPKFPNISIDEYVTLLELSVDTNPALMLGFLSLQFIRMYFNDPEKTLENLTPAYLDAGNDYKKDMPEHIVFLRQDDLNNEVADFLVSQGFSRRQTNFIRSHEMVNRGVFTEEDLQKTWTPKAIAYVEQHERLMLRIYASMGLTFDRPVVGQPISQRLTSRKKPGKVPTNLKPPAGNFRQLA